MPGDVGKLGRIAEKERLVEQARGFDLLSNVFMSVALDDKAACQHVLRILTGIQDLSVLEVRSQYRVVKGHIPRCDLGYIGRGQQRGTFQSGDTES